MILSRILPKTYRDSVFLMQATSRVSLEPGVRQAAAVMASSANLELLSQTGLLPEELTAGQTDLLVVVEAESEEAGRAALAGIEASLTRGSGPAAPGGGSRESPPTSILQAEKRLRSAGRAADLALISVPGPYAAAEARKALARGLHVMLFSDNVALSDEIELKKIGREKNLLVMGPDCGTAIIGGIPLAFANVVRRGPIGVVAASGTGLQEVTCLIDRYGSGITHAIGTGGRDISDDVGGITTLMGLEALAADPDTKVIVITSKPPGEETTLRLLEAASRAGKPVVCNLLGFDGSRLPAGQGGAVWFVETLADAAHLAVQSVGLHPAGDPRMELPAVPGGTRRFVRGLYSGGTFCYQSFLMLKKALGPVRSNLAKDPEHRLSSAWKSMDHTVVDLGDDEFTRGRPHPMIDHRLRNERIGAEAVDPETAVILLDVVLGYGAHPDPAGQVAAAVAEARKAAAGTGSEPVFLAHVCGTEGDPQRASDQERTLRDAGVIVAATSSSAVRLAIDIASRTRTKEGQEV